MAEKTNWMWELAQNLGAAQTHGFVPAPGVAAGDALLSPSAPVYGGDAPAIAPTIAASQPPVPPDLPPDAPDYGAVGNPLRDALTTNAMRQMIEAQQRARSAGAFLGPAGEGPATLLGAQAQSDLAGAQVAQATEKNAAEQAALLGKQADVQQRDIAGDQVREAAHQKRVVELQRRADAFAEQAQNVEVRNFWADKSTGSRILGILAQTLSGAANGLAGTPGAPSPLDRIIDRDLDLQKANIQNKRANAQQATNALSQAFNDFKDENQARLAMRQAATQWYASKSSQLAAQLQSETAVAKDQMVQAKAKQDIAKIQLQMADNARQADQADANANQRILAESARDVSAEQQVALAHQGDYVDVPGVSVKARKSLVNQQWTKQAQAFAGAFAQLDSIEKEVLKPGFSPSAYSKSAAGKSLLEGDVRQILGTGANLSAYEERSLKALSADYLKGKSLASLSPEEYRGYLGAMRQALAMTYRARVRATFPGADLRGDPGFESARRSIDEAEATGG